MSLLKYLTAILIISACVRCDDITNKLDDESSTIKPTQEDIFLTMSKTTTIAEIEKVDVKIYYESLCPFCVNFFVNYLQPEIPSLHKYLNLQLYPYGNAITEKVGDHYNITCQHGEAECYGNKLHACAIDIMKNVTKSTLYNCCLMDNQSDDDAATECGALMKIDANPIKECAKSDKAIQLLKYYGDETKKLDNYRGVPFILVNGKLSKWKRHFKQDICEAFINQPPPCKTI